MGRRYFQACAFGNAATVAIDALYYAFEQRKPSGFALINIASNVLFLPWPAGATLLLQRVVVVKARLQEGNVCLLQNVLRMQVSTVAIGACWFPLTLGMQIADSIAAFGLQALTAVFVLGDTVFTAYTIALSVHQWRSARRALGEGGAGDDESEELARAVRRLRIDMVVTCCATISGSFWYSAIFFRSALSSDNPQIGTASVYVIGALDSITNDLLMMFMVLTATSRKASRSLHHALVIMQQSAREQQRRDKEQQERFRTAVEAPGCAGPTPECLRALAAAEGCLRSGGLTEQTDAWSRLRSLCSEEESRLVELMRSAVSSYEVLQGRHGFLMAVQGPIAAPRQPFNLPPEPVAAVRELRAQGIMLVPEFKSKLQQMVTRMNLARVTADLKVGSAFALLLDLQRGLPSPDDGTLRTIMITPPYI